MSLGVFSWPMAQALIDILNGKSLVKATGVFIKNLPATLKKLPELMKSL